MSCVDLDLDFVRDSALLGFRFKMGKVALKLRHVRPRALSHFCPAGFLVGKRSRGHPTIPCWNEDLLVVGETISLWSN